MYIELDTKKEKDIFDSSWNFGLGFDHAYNLHRVDAINSLKLLHDEIGFKYVRFHGIFDDDMLCYQRLSDYAPYRGIPNSKSVKEINFSQIFDIYSNILGVGMKPWVELSFMPSALARGKKTGIRYLNNITQPKSLKVWGDFVEKFIVDLIHQFGKEEVESWYFEVWNEPDLPIFFKGKQKNYFELYRETALRIKKVDPTLRVGGPSSSACLWLDDFVKYCQITNTPCDFISTHHYPGDAYGNSFSIKEAFSMMKIVSNSKKEGTSLSLTLSKMFYHPEKYKEWKSGILEEMDRKAKEKVGNKPLFITEFNSAAVFAFPPHDEKYAASFIVDNILRRRKETEGAMFWCASDIYEEQFMLPTPFHGGFGLLNNSLIPKPSFYAYKMLSKIKGERIKVENSNKDINIAFFKDGKSYQIVLTSPSPEPEKDEEIKLKLTINTPLTSLNIFRIDNDHTNPKRVWKEMGSPENLNKEEVEYIKAKSALECCSYPFISSDNKTEITLNLHTHDTILLEGR